ncbi:unnamed protein product, partial [Urochloa humidicola]
PALIAGTPPLRPTKLHSLTNLTRRNPTGPAAMAEEVKSLETARAERPVWLMKCPTVVSRAWQEAAAAAITTSNPEAGGANPNPNPVVAKFKMEMAQANNGNTPKSYSLNMYNDFVPMCIFSESNQGWDHI